MLWLDSIQYVYLVGWTDTNLEDKVTVKNRWINFSHIHPALNCFSDLQVTRQEVPMSTIPKEQGYFLMKKLHISSKDQNGGASLHREDLL